MSTDDPHREHGKKPNPNPPQSADPWPVRIAVGAVGLALVAFLIGAALIAAGGKPVPTQYWSTGSAIAGALLGILAPTPTSKTQPPAKDSPSPTRKFLGEVGALIMDVWKNRQLLILVIVFLASAVLAVTQTSAPMEAVAAAAGGALIGLIAPSPSSTRDT
jgi:peptidoglycan/LPS O-acetylase OafA/YrhL